MAKIGLIDVVCVKNLARPSATHGCCCRSNAAANGASAFNVAAISVETLIEHTNIDGIVIATGAASHDELALAGLSLPNTCIENHGHCLTGACNPVAPAQRQVMVGFVRYHSALLNYKNSLPPGIGSVPCASKTLAMGRIRTTESVYSIYATCLSLILTHW